jgi:hypothetical protein
MRTETCLSLALCLIGAAVPLAWLGPGLAESPQAWLVAGIILAPFAAVAGTAWACRRDPRAARVTAAVAVLVLVVAAGGWWWAARDREGWWLLLTALLLVPPAQFLVWVGGAVVSGRRSAT